MNIIQNRGEKMKKMLIYLSLIIVLFALFIVVDKLSQNAKEKSITYNPYGVPIAQLHPETVKQLSDPNYHNIILTDDLDKRIANKESFYQYFFSSTCGHCKLTTPVIAPIIKELSLQVTQFNMQEDQEGWIKYNIQATPTLIYYKDGVEADRLVGGYSETSESGVTVEQFKAFFSKYPEN
jgi:thioredoxin 1